jgi:acetyl-CoA carboxylase alpha subunit
MRDHATFSVIAPEGAAAILARDVTQAPRYAAELHLTSGDQVRLGLADAVIPEDEPTAIDDAIIRALGRANAGDRLRRLDAVTARWVQ